jgi:hypothetical protein
MATAQPVQSSVKLDDTTAILARLNAGANQVGDAELNARFDRIDAQIKSAEKIADAQKRDAALAVIKADLDSLVKDANQEQADFAAAVNNLDQLAEQLGGDFEKLQQLNPDEQALIATAQAELDGVKNGMLVFNRAAKTKVKEDLLAEAKIEAARRMRKRLMSATLEDSIAVFQRRANEVLKLLTFRRDSAAAQVKSVGTRKQQAFKIMNEAAKAVETLETQCHDVDQQLVAAEGELKGLTNGTTEYATQQTVISNLKERSTTLNGQLNAAVTIHQSKERFALQLEVHELSQTKLRDNMDMWIAGLKSDMEERAPLIQSRLDAAKSMSVQDFASNLDQFAAKLDQSMTEFMAKAGKVSDDLSLKRLEAQPERMRKLSEVQKGQAQAHAAALARQDAVRAEFIQKYGIDPFEGSFLQGENVQPPAQQPTA